MVITKEFWQDWRKNCGYFACESLHILSIYIFTAFLFDTNLIALSKVKECKIRDLFWHPVQTLPGNFINAEELQCLELPEKNEQKGKLLTQLSDRHSKMTKQTQNEL